MDITIGDITLSYDSSGEARANIGDLATGKGFYSNTSVWGSDGFYGVPNAPAADNTACCQALVGTSGNIRIAFCPRDDRWRQQVGSLAEGDRAITTNADAGLLLQQAGNKIQLVALQQSMEVTLDAQHQTIFSKTQNSTALVEPGGLSMTYDNGAGTSGSCNVTPAGVALTYTTPGGTASISLGAGGSVSVTSSGPITLTGPSLSFNGQPFVFAGGFWT